MLIKTASNIEFQRVNLLTIYHLKRNKIMEAKMLKCMNSEIIGGQKFNYFVIDGLERRFKASTKMLSIIKRFKIVRAKVIGGEVHLYSTPSDRPSTTCN